MVEKSQWSTSEMSNGARTKLATNDRELVSSISEPNSLVTQTTDYSLEERALVPLEQNYDLATLRRIEQISSEPRLDNMRSRTFFGADPLRKYGEFLRHSLEGLRTDQTGAAAELMLAVKKEYNSLNIPAARKEILRSGGPGLISRIPYLGRMLSAYERMRIMHTDVVKHLDAIKNRTEINIGQLSSTIEMEDRRLVATENAIREIGIYLTAGQLAYKRMKQEFEAERDSKINTKDPLVLAKLRDSIESLDSFSRNLLEIRIAYEDAIQNIPDIRMGQKAAASDIQTSLATLYRRLPGIMASIRQLATLSQISKSQKGNKIANQLDIDMRRDRGQMTKAVYLEGLKAEGDYVAILESLEKQADQTIQTIDQAIDIQVANRTKRTEAWNKLNQVNTRLIEAVRKSSSKGFET